MQIVLKIIPLILYGVVGVVSLMMAKKSLLSKGFLSFHEKAAGMPLEKLDQGVQHIIIALMRTTGLGFVVVGILLITFPIITYFTSEKIIALVIPLVCAIYCLGLFLANYQLHKKSGSETPWKGSLIAVAILLAGVILSVL